MYAAKFIIYFTRNYTRFVLTGVGVKFELKLPACWPRIHTAELCKSHIITLHHPRCLWHSRYLRRSRWYSHSVYYNLYTSILTVYPADAGADRPCNKHSSKNDMKRGTEFWSARYLIEWFFDSRKNQAFSFRSSEFC